MSFRWKIAVAAAALAASVGAGSAQGTLKAVMHSDLKIVDPIWTTAYITRNHGYMIYDTLFAHGREGRDQAADGREVRRERRQARPTPSRCATACSGTTAQPVTAEDCIASIKRWGARDAIGQKLMTFVDAMTADDAKTFTIKLKEPTGLLHLRARQAVVERAVHDAEARRRDRSEHADLGLHRLRPVRLQARRVEAGRQGGLRQVRQVQAAHRAGLRPRRRQGRQGRPRRVARDRRSAAGA